MTSLRPFSISFSSKTTSFPSEHEQAQYRIGSAQYFRMSSAGVFDAFDFDLLIF